MELSDSRIQKVIQAYANTVYDKEDTIHLCKCNDCGKFFGVPKFITETLPEFDLHCPFCNKTTKIIEKTESNSEQYEAYVRDLTTTDRIPKIVICDCLGSYLIRNDEKDYRYCILCGSEHTEEGTIAISIRAEDRDELEEDEIIDTDELDDFLDTRILPLNKLVNKEVILKLKSLKKKIKCSIIAINLELNIFLISLKDKFIWYRIDDIISIES